MIVRIVGTARRDPSVQRLGNARISGGPETDRGLPGLRLLEELCGKCKRTMQRGYVTLAIRVNSSEHAALTLTSLRCRFPLFNEPLIH